MKGDFTRRTFRASNHYRSVLVQQGRLTTDADHNEKEEIQDYLDRTTTLDTVGRHGAPAGQAGMEIVCVTGDITAGGCAGDDLRITPGRYYVDGILCENEDLVRLGDQPELPGVRLPTVQGRYVAYLDVWAEHVTAAERPELREVALGGPDTATRARTIWQVRLAGHDQDICPPADPPWTPEKTGKPGRLRARAEPPADDPGPCVIPASARYRRLENQLYRVEIHTPGGTADKATFVWSRENGSVAARLLTISDKVLTIDAPGRDERLGFAAGNWVEVVDTDRTRRGEPGFLAQLSAAKGTKLTVRTWLGGVAPTGADLRRTWVVRRWESAGEVPVDTGWISLEDGVQVQFEGGGNFRTGDYWLIPARSANLTGEPVDPDLAGNVEWPREQGVPAFRPAVGIEHHYAPLALLELHGTVWRRLGDCRTVFSPLGGLVDVEYAGGDGQEAMPGDALPQPLEMSVSDGAGPVRGATVRFAADDKDGRLAEARADLAGSTASEVDSTTDADGLARCFWRPAADVTRPSQRVTARLVGHAGALRGSPVHFSASLSVAERVWFEPRKCTALAQATTVQEALDLLVSARSMVPVGGDGQAGRPGGDLPLPAEVLVRTDCGPVAGAQVRFTVASGSVADGAAGLAAGAPTVDIATGADGVARCFWRLGPDDQVQALVAALMPGTAPVEQPARLAFSASLERGRDDAPGLHVTNVVLVGYQQPLLNDSMVPAEALIGGVAVVLDGSPLAAMVTGKPVLTLTVDLPYPFSQSDRDLRHPGQPGPTTADVIGTMPLALAGAVALGDVARKPAVTWTPTAGSADFLTRLLTMMAEFHRGDRALCHLTLTGRAVAAADGRVINGLAVGRPGAGGLTELVLPTVDDVHGADFTLWFWLVQSLINLVMLPTRTGHLRLKAVRDALELSLPRDALRARLRAGVRVAEGPGQDLAAAESAASRGFRNGNGRQLVVVADERYADAAAVIRDALSQIRVEMEVIPAPDPAAAVRARTAAGQQFDGVLTDDASTLPLTDLGGFGKPVLL
jgi:hypothetical protein